jgi:exosortase A
MIDDRPARFLKQYTVLLLLLSAFLFSYFPVWQQLVATWYSNDDYTHGFLVVPLSLFIVWLKRHEISETAIDPSWWGMVFGVLTLLIYLFAYLAEIKTLASISIILLIVSAVVFLFGFQVLGRIAFPILILLFMIPIPSQIYSTLTGPLQLFVSKTSTFVSELAGVPIYSAGNVIYLPEMTFQLVQACSGLRSLISLSALCAVFGYLTLQSNALRLTLIIACMPVAVVVNIFRVVILIFASYYLRLDLAFGAAHTILGTVVFLLALSLLAAIRRLLTFWDKSATEE